jgi:hypothetical protein
MRGFNIMGFFRPVPNEPPPSRVPAVLERRQIVERELIDLHEQLAEQALACVDGHPDGRKNLAASLEKIRTAEFEIECLPLARKLAAELDKQAEAAWRADVQTLSPNEIIAGITKYDCCDRCINGCAILGGDETDDRQTCAHPVQRGALDSRYADNRQVQMVYAAACIKLNVGIVETRSEEDAAA